MSAGDLRRRDVLALGGAALATALAPRIAFAATPSGVAVHGLSAFGDLKYPADFPHFDFVNVDAPKGGTINFSPPNWLYNQSPLTFNTLNTFSLKGDAPPRMQMCFDGLMTSALDEPDTVYGLVAKMVTISEDRNSFDFALRAEAKFHDGTAITAEDFVHTFKVLKEEGHPDLRLPLTELTEALAVDPTTLRLTFSGKQSARTILDVVLFPVLSKVQIEATGFEGAAMTPMLGSGAYKVGRVIAGQTIEYERVADYWGKDLAVNKGFNNFDRIRLDFYRERQAAFEAFKKGEIHFRQEFTSRTWATGYDFPAINEGKVIKREFPAEKRPSMQAYALNQRRERFKDIRVRKAIGLCFDFEWTKRNLFYDAYQRSQTLFERSVYRAEGAPSPAELALLEPLRADLPEEAFGEAVTQPVSNGSGRDRTLLGEASRLLAEAGWKREGTLVQNAKGETLALEILVQDEVYVRIDSPWVENMRAVGIDASIRMVDSAQYQARQDSFDFDMFSIAFSFSATPTRDEMERFFHSKSAGINGSNNFPGSSSPALDALVDAVGKAEDRDSLNVAMLALDRALRARHDWIPAWYSATHRAAFWDMFGYKEPKPDFGFPVEAMWWFDEAKAKAIGKA